MFAKCANATMLLKPSATRVWRGRQRSMPKVVVRWGGGGLLGHFVVDGRANYRIAVVGEDALPGLSGEARMVAKREDHVRYVRPFLKGERLLCPCAWRRAGLRETKGEKRPPTNCNVIEPETSCTRCWVISLWCGVARFWPSMLGCLRAANELHAASSE